MWYQHYTATGSRFADHYKSYARTHAQSPDWLIAEFENIATAPGSYNGLNLWASVVEIVESLDGFLQAHGTWDRAIHFQEPALKAARHRQASLSDNVNLGLDVVRWLCSFAPLYSQQARYQDAERYVADALQATQQVDDPGILAKTVELLVGALAEKKGEDQRHEQLYQRAQEQLRKAGYRPGISAAPERLASMARR